MVEKKQKKPSKLVDACVCNICGKQFTSVNYLLKHACYPENKKYNK